jgi:hypothetical protein
MTLNITRYPICYKLAGFNIHPLEQTYITNILYENKVDLHRGFLSKLVFIEKFVRSDSLKVYDNGCIIIETLRWRFSTESQASTLITRQLLSPNNNNVCQNFFQSWQGS